MLLSELWLYIGLSGVAGMMCDGIVDVLVFVSLWSCYSHFILSFRFIAKGRIAGHGYSDPSFSEGHFVVFRQDLFGFFWLNLCVFSLFSLMTECSSTENFSGCETHNWCIRRLSDDYFWRTEMKCIQVVHKQVRKFEEMKRTVLNQLTNE